MSNHILASETPSTRIPAGDPVQLPAGTSVFIVQSLGGHVTVRTDLGLFRISREHAAAISGFQLPSDDIETADAGEFSEERVWDALKTCFDPEIPVNIVDLGLVYDLAIETNASGKKVVEVKMTLTAPGCGMGPVIAEDARQKIASLASVETARVHIVWDPIWTPQMISPAGRKTLGLE